jgi:hypothetical protein
MAACVVVMYARCEGTALINSNVCVASSAPALRTHQAITETVEYRHNLTRFAPVLCVLLVYCLQETVQSLKLRACAEFGVDPAGIEIWDFFQEGKYANLEGQLDKTLDEARVLPEQPILLDEKVRDSSSEGSYCAAV